MLNPLTLRNKRGHFQKRIAFVWSFKEVDPPFPTFSVAWVVPEAVTSLNWTSQKRLVNISIYMNGKVF